VQIAVAQVAVDPAAHVRAKGRGQPCAHRGDIAFHRADGQAHVVAKGQVMLALDLLGILAHAPECVPLRRGRGDYGIGEEAVVRRALQRTGKAAVVIVRVAAQGFDQHVVGEC
jgi:hypothetical protein